MVGHAPLHGACVDIHHHSRNRHLILAELATHVRVRVKGGCGRTMALTLTMAMAAPTGLAAALAECIGVVHAVICDVTNVAKK